MSPCRLVIPGGIARASLLALPGKDGQCFQVKTKPSSPSPALLRANQRLYALRQQAQSHKTASDQETTQRPFPTLPPWHEAEPPTAPLTTTEAVLRLPPHLGWGSAAVTAAIRIGIKQPTPDPANKPLRAGQPSFCAIGHRSHPGGQPLAVYDRDSLPYIFNMNRWAFEKPLE